MNSKDLAANYRTGNSTGMRDLITWFFKQDDAEGSWRGIEVIRDSAIIRINLALQV